MNKQEKVFIKNREGLKLCILVDYPEERINNRLAFVMHGLGSHKNHPEVTMMKNSFLRYGYVVVSFDTTTTSHPESESEGDYEYCTYQEAYADLDCVIRWASEQSFYIEPFGLFGHSMGGCVQGSTQSEILNR